MFRMMLTVTLSVFTVGFSRSHVQSSADFDAMMRILQQVKEAEMRSWQEGIQWAKHHDSRQTEFDSRYVYIDIQPDFTGQTIEATVTSHLQSLVDGLTQITLDFDDTFVVDSLVGNAASFTLVGETLEVVLDQPYDSGQLFFISTTYHGTPRIIGGVKGFRFVNHQGIPVIATLCTPFLAHTWWPCVDGPADKLDSVHLRITIPDTSYAGYPLYAASNGKLFSVSNPVPGYTTYEWHENYPIVPYYVSIAVTNYRIFSHFYDYGADSMEVPYYVFPEDYQAAQATFAETVDMIEFFAGLFGEYPFVTEKYSMAEIGFYGAIEKQTKTIIGGVYSGWYMVVCHELAHMWFGDMISPVSWHHCWINEGFATYSEALWWGDKYGVQAYHDYMETLQYWDSGTIYLPDVSDPFGVFMAICYDKGAWVLHMLRHVVGDATFFDIMYAYATDPQLMYKNASTEDFRQVCETVTGMDFTAFFDQWIYDEYYPRYTYWWSATDTGQDQYQVTVTIEQIQKQLGWRPVFEMPVDLCFALPGGDTTVAVQNDDTLQVYQFVFSEVPTAVHLDPDEWILRYVELGVEETETHRPDIASRPTLRCVPNPMHVRAVVEYTLPESRFVTIGLFNAAGQRVISIDKGRKPAGRHTCSLDASSLPCGVYFLQMNKEISLKLIKL